MRAVVTTIVATVVLFIILIAMWMTFDTTVGYMSDTAANTTSLSTQHKLDISNLYLTMRNIFTILFILALISIPIAYVVDSYRREHEEFQEFDRYGPF